MTALNIEDLRAGAMRRLPRGLFQFVDRGTEDEFACAAHRHAFDAIGFQPRVLKDVSKRHLTSTMLGREVKMPIAVAPTGAAGLLWYQGEIEVARAAAQAGVPFVLSTASIVSMEKVAEQAGGRLWFQLYIWPDRKMSFDLVDRVKSAGYEALVVTVDTPTDPNREYNIRNGFSLPMRIGPKNAVDVALHPRWLFGVFLKYLVRSGVPSLENYPQDMRMKLSATQAQHRRLPKADSLDWTGLRELRARWTGPLLVKGILHPDDAVNAVSCGVDGIIVSSHGGRNLDAAIPSIAALPRILDRVRDRTEVYVDSGFRRGSDIVKALSLGAKGVLVGRAPLWGVATAGQAGAYRALEILGSETLRVMAFLGASSVGELTPELLVRWKAAREHN